MDNKLPGIDNDDKSSRDISKSNTSFSRLMNYLSRLIWFIVFIIIIAAFGKFLISYYKDNSKKYLPTVSMEEFGIQQVKYRKDVNWKGIDENILRIVEQAREEVKQETDGKLNIWIGQLKARTENDFLNWYFGYFNQQWIGIKGLFYTADSMINKRPSADEKISEEIQREFEKRVIRPEIAEMELKRISEESFRNFVVKIQNYINVIPQKEGISQQDWESYLDKIVILTKNSDGDRGIPLTLKFLTAGNVTGLDPASAFEKVLVAGLYKTSSKIGAKAIGGSAGVAAAKGGAKIATKTVAKVEGKAGAKAFGKFLGPVIGIGIIMWDLWDHQKTVDEEKPKLRKNLFDLFDEMKVSLLNDREEGTLAIVYQLNDRIIDGFHNSKP